MKKIISLFLVSVLIFSLIACGATDDSDQADDSFFGRNTPSDILDTLLADENTVTMVVEKLDLSNKELYQTHFFVPLTSAVKEAAIASPMIGTIPFFVGVLKTDSSKNAKALANDIYDNVNYQKLICVSFNKAYTKAVGNTVILILDGDTQRADRIASLVDSLAK